MVSNIKGLGSELDSFLSPEGEGTNDGSVEIDQSLLLQCITTCVAEGIEGRQGKCIGVEPFTQGLPPYMRTAHLIGPLSSASYIGAISAVDGREVLSVTPGKDVVDLPIAKNVVEDMIAG